MTTEGTGGAKGTSGTNGEMPPRIWVYVCTNGRCSQLNISKSVVLNPIGPGVFDVPQPFCGVCSSQMYRASLCGEPR